MNSNSIWLNRLFETFTNNKRVSLVFEEKDKLKNDKVVLNLSIHPIRFADDIFFNFETNDNSIREKLKKYQVNYSLFYNYADVIKATYLKTRVNNKIKKNSLLLIGQTEEDKVIFNGVKYLSLLDYIKEIQLISERYDNIYFKPHPYANNNKYIYKILKNEFSNINIIHENIYHILSNDNVKHIIGINSSVLYEAKYFKKDVTFLYKHTFDIGGSDIGIFGDYFSSSFWSDILEIEDTNISLPFMQNRLRKTINDFWGYNVISDEIILKDIIKSKIKYFLSRYIR